MKKVRKLPLLLLFMLAAVCCLFGLSGCSADEEKEIDPDYAFELSEYRVTYDIASNCVISVTEDLTVSYLGYYSTGFIRDIPVNGGTQVRDVDVKKLVENSTEAVWYDVYFESNNFVSVDIGSHSRKTGQTESYRLTYTYVITNSVVNKSMLPLNPIGTGWGCSIYNASVKLILPDGYTNAECFIGKKGSTETHPFDDTEKTENGRTVLTASVPALDKFNGLTFNINFEKGAIKNFTDFTPFLFVAVAAIILAAIILMKLFVFNKNYLTPVVNYDTPNKMDPLLMGKLIDNKVNNEDVTSLIYYWADKGYIKINFDDENDPTLIRIMQTLPANSPDYEQVMYNNLFKAGDTVKPSELQNSFYRTVSNVAGLVNRQTRGLYRGVGLSVFFAILSGLLLGVAPFVLAMMRISLKLQFIAPFIAVVPAFIILALSEVLMFNRLKLKKNKFILSCLGIGAVCFIVAIIYIFAIPSGIMGYTAKILLAVICCLISTLSVLLISRTKEYNSKLNDIIGFKNFIMLAEKDQLEMMLEEDPQLYYHILPYAQVLGVTEKWTKKFENLTIQPPTWMTGNLVTSYMEFRLLNTIISGSMSNITSKMISKPSSSGLNGFKGGGGFGGGFGGFSGGGFGGGGGRGR